MSTKAPSSTEQPHTGSDKPIVKPADAELWHAYLRAISDYFPFSEKHDGYRIYTAPLTSFGVTIGRSVDPAIINNDLFRLGDLLLPPDSPVFLPRLSYSQRLHRYLQCAVVPPGRHDQGSLTRLVEAKEHLKQSTEDFIKCRAQAWQAFSSDPLHAAKGSTEFDFEDWIKMFYPSYHIAALCKDAASQAAYEAQLYHYGPQTASIWNDKMQLDHAFQGSVLNKPYNMPTSTAQVAHEAVVDSATRSALPLEVTYRPRYNIDSKFMETAMGWVANADNPNNKGVEIKFRSNFYQKPTEPPRWTDLGFKKVALEKQSEVVPRMPLFTAETQEKPTPKTTTTYRVGLGADDARVKVTIKASDAAVFPIDPDSSWDIPDITTRYPKLRADAPKDLFDPLVLVTHVFLGYQVSIVMELDESSFNEIDEGLSKCEDYGGSASLFGLSLGPQPTDSVVGFEQVHRDAKTKTITVPPRDNSQLTLIGLMGMQLGAPKPESSSK
ncbi:hypothetical protein FPOAC2_03673 [Fusarium poae]|uniref:hypothetical protein n=1 Tax=Fusarium poae TaxID=36050 RepID=UPI001CE862B4|nr:hypothetical protein FPOAC1_003568 [Fusarium poae]KAG8677545.1 hypothetical protein FPOAC1_003568 [Fusarium poae]